MTVQSKHHPGADADSSVSDGERWGAIPTHRTVKRGGYGMWNPGVDRDRATSSSVMSSGISSNSGEER